jgi:hypothetical protein
MVRRVEIAGDKGKFIVFIRKNNGFPEVGQEKLVVFEKLLQAINNILLDVDFVILEQKTEIVSFIGDAYLERIFTQL